MERALGLVQQDKISILIQPRKEFVDLKQLFHLVSTQVLVLRKSLEELSYFRRYQKEQIPSSGLVSCLVGGF